MPAQDQKREKATSISSRRPTATGAPVAARPPRVLLVEDDAEMARLIGQTIAENGFSPRFAASATEMDLQLRDGDIDLILLDNRLPGENGIGICRRLRSASSLPIIMLTASEDEVDRISALELGADDYMTKPFNSRELVARIRTVLRRSQNGRNVDEAHARVFRFVGWCVHTVERQLYSPEGARITLTSAEFDLLVAFCLNAGRVISREQLLDLTYGGAAGPVERTVDVHVSRIRQKIEAEPREPVLIKTVRLGGYLFTPPVDAS
jgi:two-component system, OmpR family, response regulator